MSDIYHDSRKMVGERLKKSEALLKHHESILLDYHNVLSWSNFCQELAIQAALQACMMGAAGRIGSAAAAKNAAAAEEASAGLIGRMFKGTIDYCYGLKTGFQKMVVRVGIGCTVTFCRKAYGYFIEDKTFFDGQLVVGLALATFCGVAGVPGKPVQGLFLKGPGLLSLQTFVQSIGVAGAIKNWMRKPENSQLAAFIQANKAKLIDSSKIAAAGIASECVSWATEEEPKVVQKAGQEIRKIDFKSQLSFSVRINDACSNVQIANIIKEQTAQCGMAEIRKALWVTVNQCLIEIENRRVSLENGFGQVC